MSGWNVLIAAGSEETGAGVSSMASEAGIKDISLTDGANVREVLGRKSYSVVILVLPLENEFGLEVASIVSRSTDSVLVVFAPSKVYDDVCSKILKLGAIVVPKSVSRSVAVNTIKYACELKARNDEIKSENRMLREMVNEMKLVSRAKCVLIEYLRITEKEAHRQIQKRAMDQRISLTEVAEDILKTYEYRKDN